MPAPALTPSTVAYLFASEWAPPADSSWWLGVVGGRVDGIATAGELLAVAVWSLREQGLVELEQLREVEQERVLKFGGRSFVRLTATPGDTRPPGLEGRLLDTARDRQRQDLRARLSRIGARVVDRLAGEDEYGLRGAVLAVNLHSRHPWTTVAEICQAELCDAGQAKRDGGGLRGAKVLIDPAALEGNRARYAEQRAARDEARRREPDLADAVSADCRTAVRWAYSTGAD